MNEFGIIDVCLGLFFICLVYVSYIDSKQFSDEDNV